MPYEDILYDARDGVAWITINRPEVRNAFRAKTVDELIGAFRAAWGDPEVGVVVLTGAGTRPSRRAGTSASGRRAATRAARASAWTCTGSTA